MFIKKEHITRALDNIESIVAITGVALILASVIAADPHVAAVYMLGITLLIILALATKHQIAVSTARVQKNHQALAEALRHRRNTTIVYILVLLISAILTLLHFNPSWGIATHWLKATLGSYSIIAGMGVLSLVSIGAFEILVRFCDWFQRRVPWLFPIR